MSRVKPFRVKSYHNRVKNPEDERYESTFAPTRLRPYLGKIVKYPSYVNSRKSFGSYPAKQKNGLRRSLRVECS